MSEKLRRYLDSLFDKYEGGENVKEIKEQLFIDLKEKYNDLKNEGLDQEEAFNKTINSIGDISEIIDISEAEAKELQQLVDFSKESLEDSDLSNVEIVGGEFKASALKDTDFSFSNLSNSLFKKSDLRNAKFDGANLSNAEIIKSDLKGTSFKNAVLKNVSFKHSYKIKKAIFDGAMMDKLTYALLEGYNADLENVTVI